MQLAPSDWELARAMRQEAIDVRNCFRTLAIQAIALSGGATSAIFAGIAAGQPAIGLAAIVVLFAVLSVQRIGIHKFTTATRLYGFQLYMERTAISGGGSRVMGWEEAFRAWRIVQATVFVSIYHHDSDRTGLYRWVAGQVLFDLDPGLFRERAVEGESADPAPWYLPKARAEAIRAAYHPGSYLARMFAILSVAGFLSLVPLATAVYFDWRSSGGSTWIAYAASALFIGGFTIWGLNIITLRRRRMLLEGELLSIHSCSVMWHIIALAHALAWGSGSADYTDRLSRIAKWLAVRPDLIREYVTFEALPAAFAHPPVSPNGYDEAGLAEILNLPGLTPRTARKGPSWLARRGGRLAAAAAVLAMATFWALAIAFDLPDRVAEADAANDAAGQTDCAGQEASRR